jgi:exopolysaccharide biosynthesis protein
MTVVQPMAFAKSDNGNSNNSNSSNSSNEHGDNDNEHGGNDNGHGNNGNKLGKVTAIHLEVAKVIACGSDDKGCARINNNLSLDWLELVNNPNSKQLSNIFLPPNTQQLRFVLKAGSSVVVDGIGYPLVVPSGGQSGVKVLLNKASNFGGYIQSLQLDVSKKKLLEQKKYKSQIVYTIKPVIKALSVTVSEVTEQDHPSVLATPDKESYLNIGTDFKMVIPQGAVTEPTLISVKEKKYFYEELDATGKVVLKPMLASNYDLHPNGAKFAKPLRVSMRYYPDALVGLKKTEADLTVLHDGVNIATNLNTKTKMANAQIGHFSGVTVTPYKYRMCDGTTTDTQNAIKCSEVTYYIPSTSPYVAGTFIPIKHHLASIDRKALKDSYQLRVLADGNGPFTTQTVETLAKKNNAVVAINGSLFSASMFEDTKNACDIVLFTGNIADRRCYVYPTYGVSSDTVSIIDGKKTTGLEIKAKQEVFKLGGSNTDAIPIEMEFFDSESVLDTKISEVSGTTNPFYHAIGSTTAILDPARPSDLDSNNICRNEYSKDFLGNQYATPLTTGQEKVTALGYSNEKIIMLVTDSGFSTFQQLCTLLKDNGVDHAAQLDGAGSSQLVINGKAVNATPPLRNVANAIGLVPITPTTTPTTITTTSSPECTFSDVEQAVKDLAALNPPIDYTPFRNAINALCEAKIVQGVSTTNRLYAPFNSATVNETLKVILYTTHNDEAKQVLAGLAGQIWSDKLWELKEKYKLFDGTKSIVNGTDPISRENALIILYNAFKGTCSNCDKIGQLVTDGITNGSDLALALKRDQLALLDVKACRKYLGDSCIVK